MDENKDFEEKVEEVAEEAVEAVEEAIEEAEETVGEVAEEAAEAVAEAEEAFEETAEAFAEAANEAEGAIEEAVEAPKKKVGPIIALIVVIVLVAACGVMVAMGKVPQIYNKYNHMGYVNITGRTIADIAKDNGMELSEMLEQYGLPADMPGNTQESAAYYMMPVKTIAQMYGMDFNGMKELLGFGDDVTEDTAWGIAEGEVTLDKYIGEDNLDSFKQEYGFGDEITGETKWKEVRNTVDNASKKKYDEQKAQEAQEEEFGAEEEETGEELEEAEEATEETEEAAEGAEAAEEAEKPAEEAAE